MRALRVHDSQGGFLLIDLMLAMSIVLIVLFSSLHVADYTFHVLARDTSRINTRLVAQKTIEALMNIPDTDPRVRVDADPSTRHQAYGIDLQPVARGVSRQGYVAEWTLTPDTPSTGWMMIVVNTRDVSGLSFPTQLTTYRKLNP
ncbi:MAG: hypothetical protein AB7G93_04900 [Bdellovibrionales bacterium]